MRLFNRFAVAGLVAVVPIAGVQAADAIATPIAEAPVQPAPAVDPGFDWNGFYAGIYGAGQHSPDDATRLGAGVDAGFNAQFEYFVFGGEVAVHGLLDDGVETAYGQALAKAGVVVTDDLLLYAAGGYGMELGDAEEDDALLGGGVEFAVADDLTMRAQYLHGFPVTGDNPKDQVTLGANFHF